MDFTAIQEWLGLAKNSIDLLKSATALLPKGKNRAELESRISDAENALKRSDVKLARELGFKLCDCTFPPQIMLWKETEKSHICPNSACGRKITRGMQISQEAGERFATPSGPHSWMAR